MTKNIGLATAHPFGKLRAWLKLRPFKTAQTLRAMTLAIMEQFGAGWAWVSTTPAPH
jgi:hypothetical protein